MEIGVLALQGDFQAHARVLRDLGADVSEIRTAAGLDGLDGLVIPGGESTTMTLGIEREGLGEPLREFAASGRPVFGTCAGMIMLDREHLGIADYRCARNAFGRQIRSFEADLRIPGVAGPAVRAVFIRAPWIAEHGDAVEVLASVDGHPVAARQDNLLVISFHPELAGETRLHELFLGNVRARRVTELKLYFVRHGESVANESDRNGTKRPPNADSLSERGWEQARGLGRRLEGLGHDVILASPMGRAQETAQGIAETLKIPVETDEDLFEVRQADAFYEASPDFGDTGTLYWMPDAPRDFARPGAESFDDIVARVHRVMERLLARAADHDVVAVSHHGFMHFFLGVALFDDAFSPAHVRPLYQAGHANTGITIFEHREERWMDGVNLPGWVLTTWNDQGHL